MTLRIDLDEERGFFPMETVTGRAHWDLPDGAPDGLELRLFWYTEGKGDQDVEVVETQPVPAGSPRGEAAFRFRLPHEPYSFSGKLITLAWAFELVDEATGETARKDIVLSPTGDEIRLGDAAEPGA